MDNPELAGYHRAHHTPDWDELETCRCTWYVPYFWCVGEDSRVVVSRCGRFHKVAKPGCLCLVPLVNEFEGSVSSRTTQQMRKCVCKTKDEVFCEIDVAVVFRVDVSDAGQVYKAHYSLDDPYRCVGAVTANVLRSVVPTLTMDELFSSSHEIALEVKSQLQENFAVYGYEVVDVLLAQIRPDGKVEQALNHINAARRMRVAAVDKGEGIKLAHGVQAEALAESAFLHGKGVADQRAAIIEGMEHSVADMSAPSVGLTAKDSMELILMTQYFDTLKELAHNATAAVTFIPHNVGSVHEVGKTIVGQTNPGGGSLPQMTL